MNNWNLLNRAYKATSSLKNANNIITISTIPDVNDSLSWLFSHGTLKGYFVKSSCRLATSVLWQLYKQYYVSDS